MKVLNREQERILDKLLQFAGSSGLLELALQRARVERGEKATLDDVIRIIGEIREGERSNKRQPEASTS